MVLLPGQKFPCRRATYLSWEFDSDKDTEPPVTFLIYPTFCGRNFHFHLNRVDLSLRSTRILTTDTDVSYRTILCTERNKVKQLIDEGQEDKLIRTQQSKKGEGLKEGKKV